MVTFVAVLGACNDEETDRGDLGVGEPCTENSDCASGVCTGSRCVAAPDAGSGVVSDSGPSVFEEDGGLTIFN